MFSVERFSRRAGTGIPTISPNGYRTFTTPGSKAPILTVEMKRAFVLKLDDGIDINEGVAAGYVEDVATGRELRFRSAKQLLEFLEEVVKNTNEDGRKVQENVG
jgi:hypothetical protein